MRVEPDIVTEPPLEVQVMGWQVAVYVVIKVSGSVDSFPETPNHLGEPFSSTTQLDVFSELQETLAELLYGTVSGVQAMLTIGPPGIRGDALTSTEQVSFWPALVTVTVLVPALEYEVENPPPEPLLGDPPGADQEKLPSPSEALKLAVWPISTVWLKGLQVGGGVGAKHTGSLGGLH